MKKQTALVISVLVVVMGWFILVGDSADPCYENGTCPESDVTALPGDVTATAADGVTGSDVP